MVLVSAVFIHRATSTLYDALSSPLAMLWCCARPGLLRYHIDTLCCGALCFAVLFCATLCCSMLFRAALYCAAMPCAVLVCAALCCSVLRFCVLRCTVLCCAALYCVALCSLCCTVVCCDTLYCTVLCCAVLCCVALCSLFCAAMHCTVLCCAVLCCAVLCCVALCCAVLLRAALCCDALYCAVPRCAVVCCAVLFHPALYYTVLRCVRCAVLRRAVLCSAMLSCFVLRYAVLRRCAVVPRYVMLRCAMLCCSVLRFAALRRAAQGTVLSLHRHPYAILCDLAVLYYTAAMLSLRISVQVHKSSPYLPGRACAFCQKRGQSAVQKMKAVHSHHTVHVHLKPDNTKLSAEWRAPPKAIQCNVGWMTVLSITTTLYEREGHDYELRSTRNGHDVIPRDCYHGISDVLSVTPEILLFIW